MRAPWTTLIMTAAAACSTQPTTVPARIDPTSVPLLTGEWTGTYESPLKSRSGLITFQLEQDADSTVCRGDVLMIPRQTGIPVRPVTGHWPGTDRPVRTPRLLAIESILVRGGRISGRMEPYEDPETLHPVRTTFDGHITGDTIRGTLSSIDDVTGERFLGSWSVTRRR